MDVPPELIEGLTLLSDALDDPVVDLEAILSVLTDDLVSAVPSYLGLIITLHIDGSPIIVSTLDNASNGRARASLMLSLKPAGPAACVAARQSFVQKIFDVMIGRRSSG